MNLLPWSQCLYIICFQINGKELRIMPRGAIIEPGDILTMGFEDFGNREWVQRITEKHTTAIASIFSVGPVRILVEAIKPNGEMQVKAVLAPGLEMEGIIKIVNPDIHFTVHRRVQDNMLSSYGVRVRKKALIPLRSSKRIDLTWSFTDMLATLGGMPELDWRELDLSDTSQDTMQVHSGKWQQPLVEIDYDSLDPKPDPIIVMVRRRLQKFINRHGKENQEAYKLWTNYDALNVEFQLQYKYLLNKHDAETLPNLYSNDLRDKVLAELRDIHRLCASELDLLDTFTETYITMFEGCFIAGVSLLRHLSGCWEYDKDLLTDTNYTDKFLDFLDIIYKLCNGEEIPQDYITPYPKLYADVATLSEFLSSDSDESATKMLGGINQSKIDLKTDMALFMHKFKHLCKSMDTIRMAASEHESTEPPPADDKPRTPSSAEGIKRLAL